MGSWVGVEHDDVIKLGGDAFKVFDGLLDDFDEPPGRGNAALRHDEPFETPGECAERGEWDGVIFDGDLVEREYRVEQGEDASVPRESKDLVHAGDGELSERPYRVKLFAIDRNPDVAVFLRNSSH